MKNSFVFCDFKNLNYLYQYIAIRTYVATLAMYFNLGESMVASVAMTVTYLCKYSYICMYGESSY